MATHSPDPKRFNYGKELPPITLSNTSISGLVSLIPVLVALTSRSRTPCFDNENDKPAWWPDDIQWKNPRYYSAYMGDNILKLLRKVVKSCYSYHGVEDLLCRLDEAPLLDVVDVSDDTGDNDADTPADTDTPVYVCCFCLEEFSSHQKVSVHQRFCQDKSNEKQESTEEEEKIDLEILEEDTQTVYDNKCTGFNDVPLVKPHQPHPVSILTSSNSSSPQKSNSHLNSSSNETSEVRKPASNMVSATKKNASSTAVSVPSKHPLPDPFVSILKTRSQKKLDQIMSRHNKKRMMKEECRNLKEVPKTGAWWLLKTRRGRTRPRSIHPAERFNKNEFLTNMGLTLKVKAEAEQTEKDVIEVDLDCEITCVEGPLSSFTPPVSQNNASNSQSPRGSMSLMSQLSRDDSHASRRRISFCFVDDEWADKEALMEGRNPLQMSLLTLDLSSPLGQRIKKYVNADGPMNVVNDIEVHCKTEQRDESKLRIRACDFKVTFRKKCRASSFVHLYKFNRAQVREFHRRLKTGLTFRSRKLQKLMQDCKVVLKRLKDRDVELFNEEKKVTIAKNIVVDDDLCITQIDVPESIAKSHSCYSGPPHSSSASSSSSSYPRGPLSKRLTCQSSHHRHHHNHGPPRFLHHHRPSSLRGGSVSSKPSPFTHRTAQGLSHHHHQYPPSPPHIPNIFRNRANSNTMPSPMKPQTSRRGGPGNKFHRSISNLSANLQKRHSNLDYRNAVSNLLAGPSQQHHHHHQSHPHHHHGPRQDHGHQHQQQRQQDHRDHSQDEDDHSQPLGFSTGLIITERRGPRPPTNNRRKQTMNHVRHDDCMDKNALKNSSTKEKSRSFVNLSTAARSLSRPSSSQSHRPHLQSASHHNCVNHNTPQDLTKLSNFDYFSIKQNKLLPGHSLSSPVHHQRNSSNSSANSNTRPYNSHSQFPEHSKTSSPHSCHQHRGTSSSSQKDDSSKYQDNLRLDNKQHGNLVRASDMNDNLQAKRVAKPHSLPRKVLTTNKPVAPRSLLSSPLSSSTSSSNKLNSRPSCPVDDDVMEVICIDD